MSSITNNVIVNQSINDNHREPAEDLVRLEVHWHRVPDSRLFATSLPHPKRT
jgi:hypothetical protein